MAATLHVGLTPALKRAPSAPGLPLLCTAGPRACLGSSGAEGALATPIAPSARTLFGPRAACCLAAEGPLWVSDTGHHRLLGWNSPPQQDGAAADWLIGQADFSREGRNAKGAPGAATLNVPCGITPCGAGFAVADAWNHRVLIWKRAPRAHNAPADLVLGQRDFSCVEANRGAALPGAATLFWPYGVHWDGARLWVADTGNRRVLMWQGEPEDNGQPADLVLGQADFERRDENGGEAPNASSMRWPHGIASWCGKLCVADAGNNRILIWDALPTLDNQPSNTVLGQCDFAAVDHNQSLYWPSPSTLHMPYGVAVAGDWCIVADTANSRLIGWHIDACHSGAAAQALTGQAEFDAKGDNAWRAPTRSSLCWPYGIGAAGQLAVIADSGNNRVLLWPLARELLR